MENPIKLNIATIYQVCTFLYFFQEIYDKDASFSIHLKEFIYFYAWPAMLQSVDIAILGLSHL